MLIILIYISTYFQLSNGQQGRTVSLSSDDDMIDISTSGTMTERVISEDITSSHCESTVNFSSYYFIKKQVADFSVLIFVYQTGFGYEM